ncbi:hypothetical protein EJB05_50074, partial [Eragrostis curvula]
MAVDLLGRAFVAPAAAAGGEHLAFQEAAAAGLRSLELLASSLSPTQTEHHQPSQPLGQIADQAVSRFRRVINLLDRTGHARFRRAPAAVVQTESPPASPRPAAPAPPVVVSQPMKSLTLDFTKPAAAATKAAAQPAVSATSTSFLSSVTVGGEGSVSKGQSLAVSSGKPPLPKRKHPCSAAGADAGVHNATAATAHAESGGRRRMAVGSAALLVRESRNGWA